MTPVIYVPQGSIIRVLPNEISHFSELFRSQGISLECIDFQQGIVSFPQAYVGYISLPNRRIVIRPKHEEIDLRHVIRMFYFLYASDSTDLDDPIYDIENGSSFDLIENFIKELNIVVKKGLPVEYRDNCDDLQYLRGNINVVSTLINIELKKKEVFNCVYNELSYDIPINRVLYKALLKVANISESGMFSILKRHFIDVSEPVDIPDIILNTNTMYCRKALTLAYMILNDMSISDYGEQGYGQNFLLNFDKLFEDFVKRILTVYSGDYEFTYWNEERQYAICRNKTEEYYKSYIPDMLYGFQDSISPISAYAILDMKNKLSNPFSNSDVYQMFFYSNQLHSKKVILCYPSCEDRDNAILNFDNESFKIQKIYACFVTLTGNSSIEFKRNIISFIEKVLSVL